jgi:hypothetical protein
VRRLIALSDPAQVADLDDARDKVSAIADTFVRYGDYRGAFPLTYRLGLAAIADSVARNEYRNPRWVQAFDLDFVRRYLGNLHGHLTGARVSKPWKRHYELSAGTACGLERVTAAASNVHLTVDLAETLAAATSGPQHLDDYLMISGQIIETAGQAMAAVQ